MHSFSGFPLAAESAFIGAYEILHVATGKRYVGSTNDLLRRRRVHLLDLRLNRHYNHRLQRAYNEDSRLEWFFVIAENREQAFDIEQEIIDLDRGKLFNLAGNAREAFVVLTEESREKHRNAIRGLKRSEETKERIRQTKLGVPRPAALKEKLRAYRTGLRASAETRLKMSLQRRGRKLPPRTAEHTAKIQLAKAGFRHKPEIIAHLRASAPGSRPVSIAGVQYPSLSEASRILGISHKTLRRRLISN